MVSVRKEGQVNKCVPADPYRSHSSISVLQPGGGEGKFHLSYLS